MKKLFKVIPVVLPALALVVASCGDGAGPGQPAAERRAGAASEVELTGNVVEVGMISDPSRGEIYDPAEVTVRRGDVVRFVLRSGVHNASFPAGKNPKGITLPGATPMMQLPGQAHDVAIDLPPGRYYFHCDPHVALGMIGYINVED